MALVCLSRLVNEGVNIVGVVPPDKFNPTYDFFVKFVNSLGLKVIDYDNSLKEPDFLKQIKALEPDIAVVCSYNKLFPKEFLEVVKDGFINVHPSLLPEYRGGNPYSHVIINGEKESGVTLHFMDERFDTGDIISQYKVSLEKVDTMGTLFNRLNFLAADALMEALVYYESNPLPRVKQPEGQYKYACTLDVKFGNTMIDWNKPATELEKFIRALNPFISAGTRYRGVYTKVYTSHSQNKRTKHEPGTICHIKDSSIGVACGDGILHIKTLQVGSYVLGDASDFITIFKPKIGEKFE